MYTFESLPNNRVRQIYSCFEKSKRKGYVKVTRNGKTFYQLRELKEPQSKGKEYLKNLLSFTSGKQKEYFEWQLKNSKVVELIKGKDLGLNIGRPQLKQCYKNAVDCCNLNSGVKYVEGYGMFMGIPIDHAWCVTKDGKHFDPTVEGVLEKPFDEYLAIIELDHNDILKYQIRLKTHGPYMSEVFKDKD